MHKLKLKILNNKFLIYNKNNKNYKMKLKLKKMIKKH